MTGRVGAWSRATSSRLVELVGSLDPQLADYIEQAASILEDAAPGVSLLVVSGYRSQAQQDQLRARWAAGDRTGMAYRPAAASSHSQGRAVDVQLRYQGALIPVRDTPLEYWQFLAELLAPVGVRWGGRFKPPDWNHFQI